MDEIDHAKAEDPSLPGMNWALIRNRYSFDTLLFIIAELLSQHQLLQSKRKDIENIQMKVKGIIITIIIITITIIIITTIIT